MASGLLASVSDLRAIDTFATVYNFEVEKTHTYYVGTEGVLVHNNCGVEALKKIKDALNTISVDEWKTFQDLLINSKATTAERLVFYKELAKLDDAILKAFFNDFKVGGLVFQRGIIKEAELVDIWKGLSSTVRNVDRIDPLFLSDIKKVTSDIEFYPHIEGEITNSQKGLSDPSKGGRGGHTHQAITDGKIRYSQAAHSKNTNPTNISTTTDAAWYNATTGVRKAWIDVYDPIAGIWKFKETAASTLFPSSWTKQRIIEEVASAIKNSKSNGNFGNFNGKADLWQGTSTSGILIQGYKNTSSSGLATCWPLIIP
jgi:hypothetical protein